MLAEETFLYLWFERSKMPAWGVCGGKSAVGPEIRILDEQGNLVDTCLKASKYPMKRGWTVKIRTGGGGGYGDPLERDEEKVVHDCHFGYISADHAREAYGVAMNADGEIDRPATKKLRAAK